MHTPGLGSSWQGCRVWGKMLPPASLISTGGVLKLKEYLWPRRSEAGVTIKQIVTWGEGRLGRGSYPAQWTLEVVDLLSPPGDLPGLLGVWLEPSAGS